MDGRRRFSPVNPLSCTLSVILHKNCSGIGEGLLMTEDELIEHLKAGRVDELNLISIEGGIYLLEARQQGAVHLLRGARGETTHLRSVEHARELLRELPPVPFHLVHAVVHDEMCGMPVDKRDALRVPIGFHSKW
jgi:hypothetical protein